MSYPDSFRCGDDDGPASLIIEVDQLDSDCLVLLGVLPFIVTACSMTPAPRIPSSLGPSSARDELRRRQFRVFMPKSFLGDFKGDVSRADDDDVDACTTS